MYDYYPPISTLMVVHMRGPEKLHCVVSLRWAATIGDQHDGSLQAIECRVNQRLIFGSKFSPQFGNLLYPFP